MRRSRMSLLLLIIGMVCISAAAFLYFWPSAPAPVALPEKQLSEPGKQLSEKERNLEKGRAFEDFMLQQIAAQPGMTLVGRNSDYSKNGVYAEENTQPDLRFRMGEKPFAVECKWRGNFYNNRVVWANDFQLQNYNDYSRKQNMPVLIALGIGGTPEQPEQIYLLPLERMRYATAQASYLAPFHLTAENTLSAALQKNLPPSF